MSTRRNFLINSSLLLAGSIVLPSCTMASSNKLSNPGVQLYSFRDAMAKDAVETLKKIANLGIKQIETARHDKLGHFYGLSPKEMKNICIDLGMTLRSGHVHLDKKFEQTVQEAVESGQEYLICSSLPSKGQTIDNYKSVAEEFNKAGELANKNGIKFGYHNHDYEFDTVENQVLYDILMDNTDSNLVHMELDLGWVIVAGKDPLDYFNRYKGRFPLWHLKDMDMLKKHSVEFGKGGLDIKLMLENSEASGMKYFFIEQEEYENNPFDSMEQNMAFLDNLNY